MTKKVLLITKEGCLPCLRVKRILNEMKNELPELSMDEVDFASESGMKLAIEFQVLYPPAVFIDDMVFKGKIPEDELKEAIRRFIIPIGDSGGH